MAIKNDAFLYIAGTRIIDRKMKDGAGSYEFNLFNATSRSERLSLKAKSNGIEVTDGMTAFGKITQGNHVKAINEAISEGWEVFATKYDASLVYDWEYYTESHALKYADMEFASVNVYGIHPGCTTEERQLLDECVSLDARGVDHPALTAKAFAKFCQKANK